MDTADSDAPIYAVIMAGGSGTRFWPASRRLRPKQLLPLAGDASLLRQTVDRVAPLCASGDEAPHARVLIATGRHLVAPTLAALPELSAANLLVEPVPRNTAPCIGWAAASIARRHPDAVIMALPADHHIGDVGGYRATLQRACQAAAAGAVTTIGIRPTHPEIGFGYIEAAAQPPASQPADPSAGAVAALEPVDVARFVEKPDLDRARAFVASGRHFWNAGMFFFRAADMLAAIEAHLPALAASLARLDAAAAEGREAELLDEAFAAMPAVSIDHGVMEHLGGMKMVAGDFGWSDLGSWRAAAELAHTDAHNNSAPPGAVLIDSHGCHVVDARQGAAAAADKPIALVGVEDLVVVETDDALLVVHKDAAQRVRDVVDALKARGDKQRI